MSSGCGCHLLKVLAVEEPLSPAGQSELGAGRRVGSPGRTLRGIRLDAPERNYRDPWQQAGGGARGDTVRRTRRLPRPGAHGHRPVARTRAAGPRPYLGMIAGQPDSDGLRALFTTWITLPESKSSPTWCPRSSMPPSGCWRGWDRVRRRAAHCSSWARRIRATQGPSRRCCSTASTSRTRRRALPYGGQPARLPARHGDRDRGQLGQCAARRADPSTSTCPISCASLDFALRTLPTCPRKVSVLGAERIYTTPAPESRTRGSNGTGPRHRRPSPSTCPVRDTGGDLGRIEARGGNQ